MYNEKIIKNFINPHNAGGLHGANGVAKNGSADMSDIFKIYLKIDTETDVISEAKFKTYGCPVAIACSNVTCDMLKGRTIEEAEQIESVDIINVLGGIPVEKTYCAVIAEETIKDALRHYKKNKLNL